MAINLDDGLIKNRGAYKMINISKTHENYKHLQIISKGILEQKHPRDWAKCIMIKNGIIYASNGRCMICCQTDIEDGFYNIIQGKNEIILIDIHEIDFPNVEFFKDIKMEKRIIFEDQGAYDESSLAVYIGVALPHEYVEIAKKLDCVYIDYINNKQPVKFKNCGESIIFYVIPYVLKQVDIIDL